MNQVVNWFRTIRWHLENVMAGFDAACHDSETHVGATKIQEGAIMDWLKIYSWKVL